MLVSEIAAMIVAMQISFGCPNCLKPDYQAILNAANTHGIPAEVLVWTSFFESSFRTDQIGNRGELGPVQIMPNGPLERTCRAEKLPPNSWDCAARVLSDEWRDCRGDWFCFWKVHKCGSSKTKCGDKTTQYRERERKHWNKRESGK
jgi:hypothetical protein